MPLRLEDYGLIGDTHTAALVGYDGSIDWLCLPRFDSGACFAALLGDERHGRWLLAPTGGHRATDRRYRGESLVLETNFTTADGTVRVTDCMPVRGDRPEVSRRVECLTGRVTMRSEVVIRLDYGKVAPWIRDAGRRSTFVYFGLSLVILAVVGGVAYQWQHERKAPKQMAFVKPKAELDPHPENR